MVAEALVDEVEEELGALDLQVATELTFAGESSAIWLNSRVLTSPRQSEEVRRTIPPTNSFSMSLLTLPSTSS